MWKIDGKSRKLLVDPWMNNEECTKRKIRYRQHKGKSRSRIIYIVIAGGQRDTDRVYWPPGLVVVYLDKKICADNKNARCN
jgi:hypothetical protein